MVMAQRKNSQTPLNGVVKSYNGTANGAPNEPSEGPTTTYQESLAKVPWQTDNDYILTGYRRQLPSLAACVKSAFGCKQRRLTLTS